MTHRHLDIEPGTPVEDLPDAALLDLLERGDIASWRPILAAAARAPHGPIASRVLKLVDAYPMYGTSPLWRSWVDRRQARAAGQHAHVTPLRLAALRRSKGMTQVELAHRIGMTQSDLSKLERRSDVRLSTLRTYARGLGGRVRVVFQRGDEQMEVLVADDPEETAAP